MPEQPCELVYTAMVLTLLSMISLAIVYALVQPWCTNAGVHSQFELGAARQSECHLLCFVVCKCTGYFRGGDYQKEAEKDCAEEEKEVAESYSC